MLKPKIDRCMIFACTLRNHCLMTTIISFCFAVLSLLDELINLLSIISSIVMKSTWQCSSFSVLIHTSVTCLKLLDKSGYKSTDPHFYFSSKVKYSSGNRFLSESMFITFFVSMIIFFPCYWCLWLQNTEKFLVFFSISLDWKLITDEKLLPPFPSHV